MALLREKIGVILLAGIFLASVSFLFIVISQKNFKVGMDFLIVQDKDGNQDYYSLSKSAEYVGRIFGEAVYSDLFIEEVIKTGKVSAEFFPFDKKKRLEKWNKIVKVGRNPEVSMLSVSVFSDNRDEAIRIAQGVAEVLERKSYLFRGSGVNVDVRVLSGPIVEKNPSAGRIIMVVIGGFLIGSLLAVIWIFYGYNPRQNHDYPAPADFNFSGKGGKDYAYPEPDEEEYSKSLEYLNRQ